MLWANVLHIYQPPTQSEDIVHRVVKECYGPLIDGLVETPKARITLNINGVLTEWLDRLGYERLIEGLGQAGKRGQVEFLTSAKYHALLPLIPPDEVRRQLALNLATNTKYFGPIYSPKGVFLPEMAYSRAIGDLVADMGYEYVVIDEIGYQLSEVSYQSSAADRKLPSYDRLYTLRGRPELTIFFRNRGASDAISFGKIRNAKGFIEAIRSRVQSGDQYVTTAMDGETYGHHRKGFDRLLFEAYRNSSSAGLEPVLLGQVRKEINGIKRISRVEETDPLNCNWSESQKEKDQGIAFALWKHPDNPVHRWQWALTQLTLHEVKSQKHVLSKVEGSKVKNNVDLKKWNDARETLDKGLHSDQFWWASGYKLHGSSFRFWSREMIDRGIDLLVEAITTLPYANADIIAKTRDHALAIRESAEKFEREINKKPLYR